MKKQIILIVLLLSVSVSKYSFPQWVQVSEGIGINHHITSIISAGNLIFAGSVSGGVYRSSGNGENWQTVNTGLSNTKVSALYFTNNILYAGTIGGGIFISTNSGDSWSASSGGLTNLYISCLYFSNNKIYAGTSDTLGNSGGVFFSTNNGTDWSYGGLSGLHVRALIGSGNYLLAGTGYNGTTGGIFRTTNGGVNWYISNYGLLGFGIEVNHLSADGANIYAGTGTGVYLSINNGGSWESISIQLSGVKVNSITQYNFTMFAGTPNGVYLSTNYGVNWTLRNQGFPQGVYVKKLLCTGNFLYAGTKEHSVWRRDAIEIIGIRKIPGEVPDKFSLLQNYPNPFNSLSKIRYEISKTSNTVIDIFDIKGCLIKNIVSGIYLPGVYELIFDGRDLTSGVYYCRMRAGEYGQTRKMVIIK